MIDFAADAAIFLADSEHSATVGGADPVPVIYNAPYKPQAMYGEEVATTAPACSMLDSDLVRLGVRYRTPVTISKNGAALGDFTVATLQSDSHGMTLLTLTTAEE